MYKINVLGGEAQWLPEPDYPSIPLTGEIDFVDGAYSGALRPIFVPADRLPLNVGFKYQDGQGYVDIGFDNLNLSPSGFRPQRYIPALQGTLADISGMISGDFHMEFSDGEVTRSEGVLNIVAVSYTHLTLPTIYSV